MRTIAEDAPAVYRVIVDYCRKGETKPYRTEILGPFSTLGVAKGQASRLKNYGWGAVSLRSIESSPLVWSEVDNKG